MKTLISVGLNCGVMVVSVDGGQSSRLNEHGEVTPPWSGLFWWLLSVLFLSPLTRLGWLLSSSSRTTTPRDCLACASGLWVRVLNYSQGVSTMPHLPVVKFHWVGVSVFNATGSQPNGSFLFPNFIQIYHCFCIKYEEVMTLTIRPQSAGLVRCNYCQWKEMWENRDNWVVLNMQIWEDCVLWFSLIDFSHLFFGSCDIFWFLWLSNSQLNLVSVDIHPLMFLF